MMRQGGICRIALWMCLFAVAVPAAANALPPREEPLRVVVSIRPLALLVRDIAGGSAGVEVLLPSGASPHHYSLRVSDMRKIQQADLLVWLGPEFERFLTEVAAARPAQARLNLAATEGLHWPSSSHAHEAPNAEHAGRDMHLWLNPDNGLQLMQAIAARLGALRPELAEQFQVNLRQARAELARVTQQVERRLGPLAERGFGVSHDGFGHFVDRFGLNQLAAVSAMPSQGLSARSMMELVEQMRGASCLLVEAGEAESATARLQRLVKAPAVEADPLALNTDVTTYPQFINNLGQSFFKCLTAE